jgi:hypothetical protein
MYKCPLEWLFLFLFFVFDFGATIFYKEQEDVHK